MSEDVLARLRASGVDPSVIAEVQAGYMRQADYTQKTQQAAEARRQAELQAAVAFGRQQAAPVAQQRTRVEQFLEGLGDSPEAGQVRAMMSEFASAFREDMQGVLGQEVAPMRQAVVGMSMGQELERRLESELIPMYGEGIRPHWPQLRAQMQADLSANRTVDPTAYVLRAMPHEAAQLLAARHLEEQQQTAAATGEGFASISRTTPSLGGGGGTAGGQDGYRSRGPLGRDGGASNAPLGPPTTQDLEAEFREVMSLVASGNVRGD